MNSWIIFWTVIIALGIGSFIVLVLAVIPLGGRDVWELLRRLGDGREESTDRDPREGPIR